MKQSFWDCFSFSRFKNVLIIPLGKESAKLLISLAIPAGQPMVVENEAKETEPSNKGRSNK